MPRWTPESRAKQAAAIQQWKPWKGSTGPRTPAGKAKTSRNADRGRAAMRRWTRRALAYARFSLRQCDLDLCEQKDFERAMRTGRYDIWSKKHDRQPPPEPGCQPVPTPSLRNGKQATVAKLPAVSARPEEPARLPGD